MHLLLLLLLAQEGDEAALRKQIDGIVARFGSEDPAERRAAGEQLRDLPCRTLPLLKALAKSTSDAEVKLRLLDLGIAQAWATVLGGTFRSARAEVEKYSAILQVNRDPRRSAILRQLEDLPTAEQAEFYAELYAQPDEASKDLALHGWVRVPPADAEKLAPLIAEEPAARCATRILISSGTPACIDAALDAIFQLPKESRYLACQVLLALGAAGQEARIRDAVRAQQETEVFPEGIAILAQTPTPAAEAALLDLLKDPSIKSKFGVAQALARFPTRTAEEARRDFLSRNEDPNPDRTLRSGAYDVDRALPILATLDAQTPPEIVWELAAQAGPLLRESAIAALGKAKGAAAVPLLLLLGAVGKSEDWERIAPFLTAVETSDAAADALDMIGEPRGAKALAEGFKVYTNGRGYGRALLGVPSGGIQDELQAFLTQPRYRSLQAMRALEAVRRTPTPRLRKALFGTLEEEDSWWGDPRLQVIRVLSDTKEPEDAARIERLLGAKRPEQRMTGLWFEARAGKTEVLDELVEQISKNPQFVSHEKPALSLLPESPELRKAVAAAWKRRPGWQEGLLWLAARSVPEAQEAARMQAKDRRGSGRIEALEALVAGKAPGAALELLDAIPLEQGFIRDATYEGLARGADARLRERMVQRARAEDLRSPSLRALAEGAYAEGRALFRAAVRRGVEESWEEGVIESARALGRLKDVESIPLLRSMLRASDPRHRAAAIVALAELGDRASVPEIARRLDDPSPIGLRSGSSGVAWGRERRVWDVAMEALERLTGKPSKGASFAEQREAWRAQFR